MDGSAGKWCRHPSDISEETNKSSLSRKVAAAAAVTSPTLNISQTGSWRRGMTAQVGVTAPRTKGSTSTGSGTLKTHSTGKQGASAVAVDGHNVFVLLSKPSF